MTEDETFRKLVQVPYKTFLKELSSYMFNSRIYTFESVPIEIYEKHGWTLEELKFEWYRNYD